MLTDHSAVYERLRESISYRGRRVLREWITFMRFRVFGRPAQESHGLLQVYLDFILTCFTLVIERSSPDSRKRKCAWTSLRSKNPPQTGRRSVRPKLVNGHKGNSLKYLAYSQLSTLLNIFAPTQGANVVYWIFELEASTLSQYIQK